MKKYEDLGDEEKRKARRLMLWLAILAVVAIVLFTVARCVKG